MCLLPVLKSSRPDTQGTSIGCMNLLTPCYQVAPHGVPSPNPPPTPPLTLRHPLLRTLWRSSDGPTGTSCDRAGPRTPPLDPPTLPNPSILPSRLSLTAYPDQTRFHPGTPLPPSAPHRRTRHPYLAYSKSPSCPARPPPCRLRGRGRDPDSPTDTQPTPPDFHQPTHTPDFPLAHAWS